MVIVVKNNRASVLIKDMRQLLSSESLRHFRRMCNKHESIYYTTLTFRGNKHLILSPVWAKNMLHASVSSKSFLFSIPGEDSVFEVCQDAIHSISPYGISISLNYHEREKAV